MNGVPRHRRHAHPSHVRGFTLIELMTVVGIIGVLAGIIFPALSLARRRARESSCIAQSYQIGMALSLYQEDFNGVPPQMLASLCPRYAPRAIMVCPEDKYGGYANLLAEAKQEQTGVREPNYPWRFDPNVPVSYLYAGSHFAPGWWQTFRTRSNTASVVCVLHGTPVHMMSPDVLPVLGGHIVRLHMDGSVEAEYIENVIQRANGTEFNFAVLFDPDYKKGVSR